MNDSEILNQIRNLLGASAPATTPTGPTRWWVPTDEQATAFAKKIGWTIHDLFGNRQANGSATDPFIKASDGTDKDAELYASFGFDVTGARVLWAADNREAAQTLADKIAAAPTPAAKNEIIRGAGDPGVETDAAIYLVMTNHTTGGGLLGSPRVGFAGATTVAQAVAATFAQSPRKPGQPGPGVA